MAQFHFFRLSIKRVVNLRPNLNGTVSLFRLSNMSGPHFKGSAVGLHIRGRIMNRSKYIDASKSHKLCGIWNVRSDRTSAEEL